MDSLNERLNHLMPNEISYSKAFELLQESVTYLQSKLRLKDEIIKTLRYCFEKKTSNIMGNEEKVIVIDLQHYQVDDYKHLQRKILA